MSVSESAGYNTSYIISRDPGRFGGRQSDYLQRAEQAIEETAQKITLCRESGGDLKSLFFELIADLSSKRAQIARDHGNPDAIEFGQRRDEYHPGCTSTLLLEGVYAECNRDLISLFSKHLKKMELPGKPGEFKKGYRVEDVCNERKSSLQIEVYNPAELSAKGYDQLPATTVPEDFPVDKLKDPEYPWTEQELQTCREQFRQFKADNPEKYRQYRMAHALIELSRKTPSPLNLGIPPGEIRQLYSKEVADTILNNMKSLYVHAVLRIEVAGKLYATTDYFTWMYETANWIRSRRPAEHPVELMKERSKVMALHQDEFLIKPTLQEISGLFEKAVIWKRETQSLQELKDTMMLFSVLASHNVRDLRGTAAETEWLAHAIFRSLKVKYSVDPGKMVDLEAFANPLLSDFKTAYDQMVTLR